MTCPRCGGPEFVRDLARWECAACRHRWSPVSSSVPTPSEHMGLWSEWLKKAARSAADGGEEEEPDHD